MARRGLLRTGLSLALGAALFVPSSGAAAAGGGGLDIAKMPPQLRARVSGMLDMALSTESHSATPRAGRQTNFFPRDDECGLQRGGNTKINQNCLNVTDEDLQGRGQAQNETSVAVDPNNDRHLVASYNDYRRGDGTCGTSYSLDGGKEWNDSTAPNGFTRGDQGNFQPAPFGTPREYWQASGDTSVAWDSRG